MIKTFMRCFKPPIIIMFMLVIFTGCTDRQGGVSEPMIDMNKFHYANHLGFKVKVFYEGEPLIAAASILTRFIHPSSSDFDPSLTELVFVLNESEAYNFPPSTIVAWPREDEIEGLIVGIHWRIENPPSDLRTGLPIRRQYTVEEFGLTYPLQPIDLIENWEKVWELWSSVFRSSEQSFIRENARYGGPEQALSEDNSDE